MPGHGWFVLSVPGEWAVRVSQKAGGLPPTIVFRAKEPLKFKILVSPQWSSRGDPRFASLKTARKYVENAANSAAPGAVDTMMLLRELTGTSGRGYYFAATGRAPKPGEYRYTMQGALVVGKLITTFTILTDTGAGEATARALSMMESAKHALN